MGKLAKKPTSSRKRTIPTFFAIFFEKADREEGEKRGDSGSVSPKESRFETLRR